MNSEPNHDVVEKWAAKHHGKLELTRTILSIFSATISSILLLRLLGKV